MTARSIRVSSLAALALACGNTAGPSVGDEDVVAEQHERLATSCTSATSASGWLNQPLDITSSRFSVHVEAKTGGDADDVLFGLSNGAADQYSDLAAIVRFSPAGLIDARNGGGYGAAHPVAYRGGEIHYFDLLVDLDARRYSVIDDLGLYRDTTIASDYAFRTEQAGVSALNSLGMKVDSGGPLELCNVIVSQPGCYTAGGNEGFFNHAFAAQNSAVIVSFEVIPSALRVDGVIGLASGEALRFDDFAAAIRFNENGTVDARNGSAYAADEVIQYEANRSYPVSMIVDVLGHAYSAFVDGKLVAKNYAFRTSQANVAAVDHVAFIADSAGSFRLCGIGVFPPHAVASLHHVAPNTPPEDPRDAAGNRYVAGSFSGSFDAGGGPLVSAGGTDVYVAKYAPNGAHVWSRRFGGPGDDWFSPPVVNGAGELVLRVGEELVRLAPDGAERFRRAVYSFDAYTLDANGQLVTGEHTFEQRFFIRKLEPSGALVWSKEFPITEGGATVRFIGIDTAENVHFAGSIDGGIDLGTRVIIARSAEGDSQSFLVKLDSSGTLVYGRTWELNLTNGLAVDLAGNATIAGYDYNPDVFRLSSFDPNGVLLRDIGGDQLVPPLFLGSGGPPYANADGGITWRISPRRGDAYLNLVVTLDPLP